MRSASCHLRVWAQSEYHSILCQPCKALLCFALKSWLQRLISFDLHSMQAVADWGKAKHQEPTFHHLNCESISRVLQWMACCYILIIQWDAEMGTVSQTGPQVCCLKILRKSSKNKISQRYSRQLELKRAQLYARKQLAFAGWRLHSVQYISISTNRKVGYCRWNFWGFLVDTDLQMLMSRLPLSPYRSQNIQNPLQIFIESHTLEIIQVVVNRDFQAFSHSSLMTVVYSRLTDWHQQALIQLPWKCSTIFL